jgi:hypothetical protein
MPMHDWTVVDAGIFHAFHHGWIYEIANSLNQGLLPSDYYALPEQIAAGLGPDVLALQENCTEVGDGIDSGGAATATALSARPKTRFTAEADAEFYRRKKKAVAVRHISGDRIVAFVEIVSPGNKSSRQTFQAFVDKAWSLLERRIHLLIIDPFPPGSRDPNGIHAAIWQEMGGDEFRLPDDKSLTLVAYECDIVTRAYIEPIAVGDTLPDMSLFLEPNGCVNVPLEATYQAVFANMPRRWREVLQATVGADQT